MRILKKAVNQCRRFVKHIRTEIFITNTVLLLLFIIRFLNPDNKTLVLFFIVFLMVIWVKLHDITLAAFLTFSVTGVFFVGKEYIIQLNDLNQYPNLKELYPLGLYQRITISASDVIFPIFFLSLFSQLKKLKNLPKKVKTLDIIIFLFLILSLVADIIASKRIFLSLLLKRSLIESVIIYFYLRFLVNNHVQVFKIFLNIMTALVFFESFIAIQQFIQSSSLGKNFEIQKTAEIFGGNAEESAFAFRPTGTLPQTNDLGLFLSAFLPFIFIKVLVNKEKFFSVSLIMGITTVLLTLSRSAWLGLAVGLLYLFYMIEYRMKINLLQKIKAKTSLILLLLFCSLLIYIMPRLATTFLSLGRSGGLYFRFRQIQESWGLFKSSPLIGVGTGMSVSEILTNYRTGVFSEFPSVIHNYYFLLLLENGIIVFSFFILIILFGFKQLFTQKNYLLVYAALASYTVIIIGGIFQPLFNFTLIFILLALAFSKIGYEFKNI